MSDMYVVRRRAGEWLLWRVDKNGQLVGKQCAARCPAEDGDKEREAVDRLLAKVRQLKETL